MSPLEVFLNCTDLIGLEVHLQRKRSFLRFSSLFMLSFVYVSQIMSCLSDSCNLGKTLLHILYN